VRDRVDPFGEAANDHGAVLDQHLHEPLRPADPVGRGMARADNRDARVTLEERAVTSGP